MNISKDNLVDIITDVYDRGVSSEEPSREELVEIINFWLEEHHYHETIK